MPTCAICHTDYPAGTEICPADGASLGASPGAAASTDGASLGASPGAAASTDGARAAAYAPTMPTPAGGASAEAAAAPAEDGFDSLIGAVLAGRYQIIRRIGEGGMGAVYEAKHTLIGKRVAVKVLLEKFVAKSDFVARLLQEARLASSIGHENIVDVTDFGTTDDGRSFVVMEFLDGESLAELTMREAPLPIERSLRIARQAASALGAAHAKGIVHRDVKPENIYLVQRGDADFVKVVDFGISKAVKPGGGDEAAEGYRLTHTGLLLGTPLYMSPEQARGEEDLDHRVDIWALGVLLYECLTGEVPFRANNYLEIISQVLTHDPGAAVAASAGAGDPRRGRGGGDARDGEGPRRAATRRWPSSSAISSACSAGDQNVGLPPVPEGAARVRTTAPRRWPLVTAAVLVLAGGVALALNRPSAGAVAAVAAVGSAARPRAPRRAGRRRRTGRRVGRTRSPSPRPARPPFAPAPPRPPSAPAPDRRPPLPARRSRLRAERQAKPPVNRPTNPEPSESVKRGVLPSGSREAYPDK